MFTASKILVMLALRNVVCCMLLNRCIIGGLLAVPVVFSVITCSTLYFVQDDIVVMFVIFINVCLVLPLVQVLVV